MPAVHVTEAESAILEVLWRHGPLPPSRLISEVQALRHWGAPTIKTLLGRLILKQVVRSEKHDGVVRYRPLLERGDYVRAEVGMLLGRLFDGDPQALIEFLRSDPSR